MKKIICALILIFSSILTACSSFNSNDYVMEIDGEKISIDEYSVYLDEQIKSFEEQGGSDIWEVDFDGVPAKEVAKQNASNTLIMVKAAVAHADQLGVALSDDDIKKAHQNAKEVQNHNDDIDLLNKIMEETAIQSKIYDKITDSFQINDNEFETYLTNYYEQNKEQYTTFTAKEIFIQSTDTRYSYDDIKAKYSSLKSQDDFDKFANEVSPNTDTQAHKLDSSLYPSDVMEQLASSSIGSIVLAEDTTGYHIFYISNISVTPMDDIRESVKQNYITEKKQEIYNTQNNSWTSSMTIQKNDAVYNSIDIDSEISEEESTTK